ncbi:MAG: methyltransferase domain-containing protein [Catenulispora sp.]|nr:methyltransferase domain-containing protein [Catenulispora sp.]
MNLPRYRFGARFYDTLSAERLVYRAGRVAAIELLGLRAGDRVLVVGCGTGLDLPYLVDAVGPDGQIVGVDASAAMLRRAAAKVRRGGWGNVRLVHTDATELSDVDGLFDAVLFTYSLSVIENWRGAWDAASAQLRAGGKVSVVDTDLPTGAGLLWRPLAALALWTGGVHRRRKVWELVDAHAQTVTSRRLASGHIHVAVGTVGGRR